MCADRIYACQVAVYRGERHVTTAIPSHVESYATAAAHFHCAAAPTEARAREELRDLVGGWCAGHRFDASFSCEEMVKREKVEIHRNPGLGTRLALWLKALFL